MATSVLVNKLHVKDISWHGMAHFCTGRHSPGFQHCLENRSQPTFFPELCSGTAWEVLVGLNQNQARAVPAVESRDGHAPLISPWSCLIYLHNDEYYTGTSAPQFFLELLLPTHPRFQFACLTLIDHSLPEVSCCTCIFLHLTTAIFQDFTKAGHLGMSNSYIYNFVQFSKGSSWFSRLKILHLYAAS